MSILKKENNEEYQMHIYLSSIRDQEQHKITARDSFPYITESTAFFGEANSTCFFK